MARLVSMTAAGTPLDLLTLADVEAARDLLAGVVKETP
jgi:threonine dehydratase